MDAEYEEIDQRIKLVIETFKESGKLYDTVTEYLTDIHIGDTLKILEEASKLVPQKEMRYTVELSQGDCWNKYLVSKHR